MNSNLNMKVELLDDNDQVTEERRMPKCYPYQIQNLPWEIKKLRITWLDEHGKEAEQSHIYIIGTRDEIYELLKSKGKARHFIPNTETDPKGSKFIVSEDGDVRRLYA